MNLTNIAVPSLIANDLVIVHPMTSYSGSVAYLKYVATSDKNDQFGKMYNSAFALGEMNEGRMNYTAQAVVENLAGTEEKVCWTPVLADSAKFFNAEGQEVEGGAVAEDGTLTIPEGAVKVAYKYNQEYIPAKDIPSIGPKMVQIPLVAEPRRIAVKYDQITAFQA